jgi:3-keto-disaccharide hydrolase
MSSIAAIRIALLLCAATAVSACQSANGGSTTSTSANTLSPSEQQAGWKLLFDGTSTSGWRNYRKETVGPGWTVVNGALTRSGDSAGDIITVDKYRNFELALDWRVSEGGNSGIFYRATEDNNYIWQSAPEMQVLDDARHSDGKSPLTSAGSNFALYPAPRGIVHPAGEWNSARILVNGSHVEHWLNGQKLLEYELGSAEWTDRVAKSKFSTMPNYGKSGDGHIGLQDHGDRVEFRNIRIRVLP